MRRAQEVVAPAYESVLSNTIPLQDVLQVGRDNFMFGRLYNEFLAVVTPGYAPFGEYANTGIALILFFLFACGVVQLWREARIQRMRVLWPALAIATLLTWLLALRVGGYSGWFLVLPCVSRCEGAERGGGLSDLPGTAGGADRGALPVDAAAGRPGRAAVVGPVDGRGTEPSLPDPRAPRRTGAPDAAAGAAGAVQGVLYDWLAGPAAHRRLP